MLANGRVHGLSFRHDVLRDLARYVPGVARRRARRRGRDQAEALLPRKRTQTAGGVDLREDHSGALCSVDGGGQVLQRQAHMIQMFLGRS